MNSHQWLELALYIGALVLVTKPLGLYLNRVLDAKGRTWLDPVVRPLEKLTYRVLRVDRGERARLEAIRLRDADFQPGELPFHLRHFAVAAISCRSIRSISARCHRISRSTPPSVSPPTPTGRATAANPRCRYFSQMVALAIHNFFSAAVGIAIAAALVRGIARHTAQTIGNFWVDLTRIIYYLLLPICLVLAVFLRVAGHDSKFQALHGRQTHRATNRFRPENRRERQTGRGRQGQSGDGEPDARHADHRAGADGVADRHQDAGHQRRRLHQRQRRASV